METCAEPRRSGASEHFSLPPFRERGTRLHFRSYLRPRLAFFLSMGYPNSDYVDFGVVFLTEKRCSYVQVPPNVPMVFSLNFSTPRCSSADANCILLCMPPPLPLATLSLVSRSHRIGTNEPPRSGMAKRGAGLVLRASGNVVCRGTSRVACDWYGLCFVDTLGVTPAETIRQVFSLRRKAV